MSVSVLPVTVVVLPAVEVLTGTEVFVLSSDQHVAASVCGSLFSQQLAWGQARTCTNHVKYIMSLVCDRSIAGL